MMKDLLCRAFCDLLAVRRVPAGFAIETPYRFSDGDPLIIYAVKVREGFFRLEDAGVQIPMLEAEGIDLKKGMRGEAFAELLHEYGLVFDDEGMNLRSGEIAEDDIGRAALGMMAMLLRLQDFALLSPARVEKTWQEDALRAIHQRFDGVATVEEHSPAIASVTGMPADAVIRFNRGGAPLAIFLATSDAKALQALVLKMELEKYQHSDCYVVLMLERAKQNPVREGTYALSQSRLDEVLTFRGAETEALSALARYEHFGSGGLQ